MAFPVKIDSSFRQEVPKDEGFTLRYLSNPSDSPLSLRRDGNAHAVEMKGGASFRGHAERARDVDCILLWNDKEQSYEIKTVGCDMVANPVRERPSRASSAQPSKSHILRAPSRQHLQMRQKPPKLPAKNTTPTSSSETRQKVEKRSMAEAKPPAQASAEDDDFDGLAEAIADELNDEPQNSRQNSVVLGTSGYAAHDDGPTSEEE